MPETVVMKFGGTSVGSTEKIKNVAKRVASRISQKGDRVVVVVSAMSGETDRLIGLARDIAKQDELPWREYHHLVSSGEQVSSALTAMALQQLGQKSTSLLAHQLKLKTKHVYGHNLIESIDTSRLEKLLSEGVVPVVAGFQGIDDDGDVTTLGRGGSDTTAVALAAALGSCRCEILTDVDGVYSAPPPICKGAKKLKSLSYEEMLELASSGAKVLQARSVSLAKKYRVPLMVGLSFSEAEGTEIVEEYEGMEEAVVTGVSCRKDQAKLTLRDVSDEPGKAAKVFQALGEAQIIVDMIVQSQGTGGKASISCTMPEEDADRATKVLEQLAESELTGAAVEVDRNIAKLVVVGEGMRNHAGVASKMFDVLATEGINVEMITTSEIKISVAIQQKYAELAVRALHECFVEQGQK